MCVCACTCVQYWDRELVLLLRPTLRLRWKLIWLLHRARGTRKIQRGTHNILMRNADRNWVLLPTQYHYSYTKMSLYMNAPLSFVMVFPNPLLLYSCRLEPYHLSSNLLLKEQHFPNWKSIYPQSLTWGLTHELKNEAEWTISVLP